MSQLLLFNVLRRDSDIQNIGMSFFQGTEMEKKRAYLEARSFIEQALTFYETATDVKGHAAALPLYYAALNFAKAELLTTVPAEIIGKRIHHGLTYDVTSTRGLGSDYVTVADGVFPRLYKSRTGKSIRQGVKLRIKKIIGQIPEIGWESGHLGPRTCRIGNALHSVVWGPNAGWSMIATNRPDLLSAQYPAGRLFQANYEEVALNSFGPPQWRGVFAVSARSLAMGWRSYQARWTEPITDKNGVPLSSLPVLQSIERKLPNFFQVSVTPSHDAEIVGDMYKSSNLVMPSSLARYVLSFYLSSIVRYRPSKLDARLTPLATWIADAFTSQAPIFMLRDAVGGIEKAHYLFGGADGSRS